MSQTAEKDLSTQMYEIYIKAPPQKIWDAITQPEWNAKYGYQGAMEYDLRPGGAFKTYANPTMREMGMPEVIVDGEVLEADPPHKLVQTYRMLFDEATKAEGFTRITWEIEAANSEFSRLTIRHEMTNAPIMAGMVSSKFLEQGAGGWSWILSDLKSLLETGSTL